jgi:DNA-binding HxlR family transcriptional regulator
VCGSAPPGQRAPDGAVPTFRCIFPMTNTKNLSQQDAAPSVAGMVEDVVGCKWSMTVIGLVRDGVHRPGAMEHAIDGLSAKVLNERLRKLLRYGVLEKHSYPEIPPRVEYHLTTFGQRFAGLVDEVRRLQAELDGGVRPGAPQPTDH